MAIEFKEISYKQLNARQQENYNFLKISAVLAGYGFMTMRLSDDWQGADFIALHIDGETLKVQLKGRLTFDKKYKGKNLYVAFPACGDWYLYPHDDLLDRVLNDSRATSKSWQVHGLYHFPRLSKPMRDLLKPYRIRGDTQGLKPVTANAENPENP